MKHWLFTLSTLLAPVSAWALESDAAPQATRPEAMLDSSQLLDTGLGLIAVLALMLGLAWLVKRYVSVPGMGRGQVQIVGGVSLGPRERAVLLQVEGQRLLVGVAPGRVQTLHVLSDKADDGAFAEQLEQAVQQEEQA